MSTTKIAMLRNPAVSLGCKLMEGETGEVETSLADMLVRIGIAVAIETPKTINGVPSAPEIVATAPVTRTAETEATIDTKGKKKHS